jgi:hypothetical protein
MLEPGAATQTNNDKGAHPNISQRHRLCTHNHTYNPDYVSSNLQLSSIEEGLKTFRREAGEKPPREVGKRVKVRAYKPK